MPYSGYVVPKTGELIVTKPSWFNYETPESVKLEPVRIAESRTVKGLEDLNRNVEFSHPLGESDRCLWYNGTNPKRSIMVPEIQTTVEKKSVNMV